MCNFSEQSPLCGVCNILKGLLVQHFRIKHAVRIKVVRKSLNYKNGVPSNKISHIENDTGCTRLALRSANRSRSEVEKLVTGRKNTEECFTLIESGKDANKFKCKDCSFVSLWQNNVKRHYERTHINDKQEKFMKLKDRFRCDACNFESVYETNVTRHYRRAHGKIPKSERCKSKADCIVPSNLDSEFTNYANGIETPVTVKNEISEETEYVQVNEIDVGTAYESLLSVVDTVKSEKSATSPPCGEITQHSEPLNAGSNNSDADTIIGDSAELVASPTNGNHNEQTLQKSLDGEECYSVTKHKVYRVVHDDNGKRKFQCLKCPFVTIFSTSATRHYDRYHANIRRSQKQYKSSHKLSKRCSKINSYENFVGCSKLKSESSEGRKSRPDFSNVDIETIRNKLPTMPSESGNTEPPNMSYVERFESTLSNKHLDNSDDLDETTQNSEHLNDASGDSDVDAIIDDGAELVASPTNSNHNEQTLQKSLDGEECYSVKKHKVYRVVHDGNGKRKFQCLKCPFVTLFSTSATRHYDRYHANIRRSQKQYGSSHKLSKRRLKRNRYENLLENTNLKSEGSEERLSRSDYSKSDIETICDELPTMRSESGNTELPNVSDIERFEGTLSVKQLENSDDQECFVKSRKFKCKECDFVGLKSSMKCHYERIHIDTSPYAQKRLPAQVLLTRKTLKCHLCNFVAGYQSSVNRHFRRVHGHESRKQQLKSKPQQCDDLPQSSTAPVESDLSMPTKPKNECFEMVIDESGKQLFKCLKCTFVTSFPQAAERHSETNHMGMPAEDAIKKVTVNVSRQFECLTCGHRTQYKQAFKKHFKKMHAQNGSNGEGTGDINTENFDNEYQTVADDESERYQCSICGLTSKLFGSVERHFEKYHHHNGLLCDICGEHFEEMTDLRQHRKKKHSRAKPKKCHLCSKTILESSFLRHLRTHTDEMPYCCEICGQKYKNATSLKYHLAMHSGLKLYECKLCDFKTHTNPGLKTHIKIRHTDIRDFPCPYCDLRFKLSSAKHKHIRRMHLMERNHVCNICGFAFIDKSALIDHSFSHTDIRRFTCTICEQTYKYRGHARKHCYKSHPEIPRRDWKRYFLGFDKQGKNTSKTN